jgi:hypothetical protein
MLKNQINNKELEKIMATEGEVKGVVFQTDAKYLLEKVGKEALKKVEEKTKEWGYPIDYKNIRPFGWYPIGLRVISLLAITESLNWGEKEIFEMGNAAPKFSIVVKMLLKYFVSLKKSVSEVPNYWQKHYTVGKISCPEFHESEKWLVIRLEGLKIHPILCSYFAGYFLRIAQYVIKSPKIEIKEIKCMYRGDPYHEYYINWK